MGKIILCLYFFVIDINKEMEMVDKVGIVIKKSNHFFVFIINKLTCK